MKIGTEVDLSIALLYDNDKAGLVDRPCHCNKILEKRPHRASIKLPQELVIELKNSGSILGIAKTTKQRDISKIYYCYKNPPHLSGPLA